MKILETDRLILRHQTTQDAAFILELLNDPSWIQNIGDRGVRTLDDARKNIIEVPMKAYAQLGFGFYLTELKEGGIPLGICGLAKRDFMEDVDIGFAFLPRYWGKGYAYEAASAVMDYAKDVIGLKRIAAITAIDNQASAKLLEKLGLQFEGIIPYAGTDEEVRLYAVNN